MIILDIETPKDCFTCQFVDSEWGYCTCTVDHSIIADVLPKGVKHEKCPIKKKEEYLAVAAKMVLDFVEECEGYTDCITTPDGEKLHSDWGSVEDGLIEIIQWEKRKESQCEYERHDVQSEENMQMDDLRKEQEERLVVAPILNPKTK